MAAREVVLVALLVFDDLGLLLAWLGRLVMLLVLLVLVLLVLLVEDLAQSNSHVFTNIHKSCHSFTFSGLVSFGTMQ